MTFTFWIRFWIFRCFGVSCDESSFRLLLFHNIRIQHVSPNSSSGDWQLPLLFHLVEHLFRDGKTKIRKLIMLITGIISPTAHCQKASSENYNKMKTRQIKKNNLYKSPLGTTLCRSKDWIGMKVWRTHLFIRGTRKLWWIILIKQKLDTTAVF